jgi:predicted glycoside hydrolase/deacetylase ChbG (UPF0249 family)
MAESGKKKLIINADDFGLCAETNRAVAELFSAGKITSTSLLAAAPFAEEAVALAKSTGFAVGAHLVLNSDFYEYPWKSLTGAKSLIDSGGNLSSDLKHIAKHARGRDVTKECQAQIDFILSRGAKLDHIDNHCATMYGINMRLFFINAYRLCRKYKQPFRFPKFNRFLTDYFPKKIPAPVKLAHKVVYGVGRLYRVKFVDDIVSNPYKIEDIPNYAALRDYYLSAIANLSYGTTDMFLHPSYHCPELARLTPEWKKREWELELLQSGVLLDRAREEGVELISYSQI